MKIALAQIDSSPTDLNSNIEQHMHKIEEAINAESDLIVFPELSLSGDGTQGQIDRISISLYDERLIPLVNRSHHIDIVCGLIEQDAGYYYNSAIYLGNGQIKHVHRKVFLASYATFIEDQICVPGTSVDPVDTSLARISLLVCNDLWHPILPYMAALHGIDILLVPSNSAWSAMGDQLKIASTWESMNRAYAGMLGVYVVFVNRSGARNVEAKFLQYWGGSEIITPGGDVLIKAPYAESTLIFAEIDLERARTHQENAHIFRDFDSSAMQREFTKAITARKHFIESKTRE